MELDVGTAQRLVALADGTMAVEAIVALPGGQNSAVFEARSADGRSVVLKIYDDAWHWKMLKEIFVYDRLREHGVDSLVPAVLAADDSKSILDRNVLVMTKLEGLHVLSILDDLAEAQLLGINSQIGSILHELHQVGFDSFGYVGTDGVVDAHQTNLEYMHFQFDKKVGEFLSLGGDSALAERIRRYASEREPVLATCLRPSFCHNDCHYGNVLVVQAGGSWRVSGLVDFENVLSGDPLLDLAKTHCYASRRSERTLAALASGHGAVPDGWREAIDVYVVYHWIELWDWFASVGQTQWLDGIDTSLREVEGL